MFNLPQFILFILLFSVWSQTGVANEQPSQCKPIVAAPSSTASSGTAPALSTSSDIEVGVGIFRQLLPYWKYQDAKTIYSYFYGLYRSSKHPQREEILKAILSDPEGLATNPALVSAILAGNPDVIDYESKTWANKLRVPELHELIKPSRELQRLLNTTDTDIETQLFYAAPSEDLIETIAERFDALSTVEERTAALLGLATQFHKMDGKKDGDKLEAIFHELMVKVFAKMDEPLLSNLQNAYYFYDPVSGDGTKSFFNQRGYTPERASQFYKKNIESMPDHSQRVRSDFLKRLLSFKHWGEGYAVDPMRKAFNRKVNRLSLLGATTVAISEFVAPIGSITPETTGLALGGYALFKVMTFGRHFYKNYPARSFMPQVMEHFDKAQQNLPVQLTIDQVSQDIGEFIKRERGRLLAATPKAPAPAASASASPSAPATTTARRPRRGRAAPKPAEEQAAATASTNENSPPKEGAAVKTTKRRNNKALGQTISSEVSTDDLKAKWTKKKTEAQKLNSPIKATPGLKESSRRFFEYFSAIANTVKEKDRIIYLFQLGMVAGKQHIVLLSEPGEAKSMLSNLVLSNVKKLAGGVASLFKLQNTPETTISETHGAYDPKKLTEEGIYERLVNSSLAAHTYAILSEFFDSPTIRNVLTILNEGNIDQGSDSYKGILELTVVDSNYSIPQIYGMTGGDSAQAVLDRFGFFAIVPDRFADQRNAMALANLNENPNLPDLYIEDIHLMREWIDEVELSEAMKARQTYFFEQLKFQFEEIQEKSKEEYAQSVAKGKASELPKIGARVFSSRTLRMSFRTLKTIALLDWLSQGAKGKPKVEAHHLTNLAALMALNGPDGEFLDRLIEKTHKPTLKSMYQAVRDENGLYFEILRTMSHDTDQTKYGRLLAELRQKRSEGDFSWTDGNLSSIQALLNLSQEIEPLAKSDEPIPELTPSDIALQDLWEEIQSIFALEGE